MSSKKFNGNILSITLFKQKCLQREMGTDWWYGESKTAFTVRLFHKLSLFFTLAVNLIIIYNYAYRIFRYSAKLSKQAEVLEYTQRLWTYGILSAAMLAAFILTLLGKRRLPQASGAALTRCGYILSAVSAVGLGFASYDVLVLGKTLSTYADAVNTTTANSIYMRLGFLHILPLAIFLISAVIIHIMQKRYLAEIKSLYDGLINRIYKDYTEQTPDYTEKMWEEYLDSYKEEAPDALPLKRSKKARIRKSK